MAKEPIPHDPLLSKEEIRGINKGVRGLPLSPLDRRDLARDTGAQLRQVNAWFAPAGAKVRRSLIPLSAADTPLSALPPALQARVTLGITLATPFSLPSQEPGKEGQLETVTPAVTQTPLAGHDRSHWKSRFETLAEARARVEAHKEGEVHPYVDRHWHAVNIRWDPDEDAPERGAWEVDVEYDHETDDEDTP